MNTSKSASDACAWADAWLDGVVAGSKTMSQRKADTVKAKMGSLKALAERARARGVHLLQLEDDHGVVLVAASLRPFKVLC